MKKLLYFMLAIITALGLAACGAPAISEPPTDEASAPEPSSSPEIPKNMVPEALIGTWEGTGEPVGGGAPLSLKVVIYADGTGNYVFEQAGYTESYPITLTSDAEHFSVDIPSENALGISKSGGTYSYEDGILTLHITTDFTSGRQYKYIVDCEKTS